MTATNPEPPPRPTGIVNVIDGRWKVDRQIGTGSFGEVYHARDMETGERVALKVFKSELEAAGYLRELGLLFNEEHRNVVPVRGFGYTAGRKYIAYEYLGGGNLRDFLVRNPRVEVGVAVEMVRDIARGLHHAHSKNIVHRDLKPENVLLVEPDWPSTLKLCDFGLSVRVSGQERLTARYGSPGYMAPEQFQGSYDHRVDFYAMGIILYEMLFGRRPFGGDLASLRHAHSHREVAVPERTPAELSGLIRSLLAKDPQGRPANTAELLALIDETLGALKAASSSVMPDPVDREAVRLESRWTARLDGDAEHCQTSRDGCLLLGIDGRLVAVSPEGRLEKVAPLEQAPLDIIEGAPTWRDAVWVDADGLQTLQGRPAGRDGHAGALGEEPRLLLRSPARDELLVSTLRGLRLVELGGTVHWEANVDSYGTVVPASFSDDGETIWVATEAPRTRLVALSRDGERLAEMIAGGSDVAMAPVDDAVIVGSRGSRQLRRLSREGYCEAELELGEPLVGLQTVGDDLLAVYSHEHIEVVCRRELDSLAMLPLPSSSALIEYTRRGVYTLDVRDGRTTIQFFEFVRGA